jgi:hypothetical protein
MDAKPEAASDPQHEQQNEAGDFESQVANDERDQPKGTPVAGKEQISDGCHEQQSRRHSEQPEGEHECERRENESSNDARW